MNFNDILAQFESPITIKELQVVDLILSGKHYCTEIYHWQNLQKMSVYLYSQSNYNNRISSKLSDMFLIKTIFYLPVEASDIIEAETIKCPF